MGLFNKIKLIKPRRSVFRLSHSVRTTMNIGEIVPTCFVEMVPGDTFRFGQVATVELQPLVAPFKGDLWQESAAFFVPYDILALDDEDKFTQILATVVDTQSSVPIPKWDFESSKVDSQGNLLSTKLGTLWDKYGFPLNVQGLENSITPIAYLQRAYYSVYNEYLRDENMDLEHDLIGNELMTICYKKDNFTSAFDSPQKGVAPSLQLTGTASSEWATGLLNTIIGEVVNISKVSSVGGGQGSTSHVEIASGTSLKIDGNSISAFPNNNTSTVSGTGTKQDSKLGVKVDQNFLDFLNNNLLQMSNIITFNINDLRLLNKLQIWLERNQLAGSRTKEYLLANYGIAPSDETLQRPQFLGRLRTPVIVNSNLSSVEYVNGQTRVPQGTKSGNGTAQNAVLFKKWTCKEPGLILVLSWLRPKATYSQGINRMWIKDSVYDYCNPIFQNLGQQPIYNCELFADNSTVDANGVKVDTKVFGFEDRYTEMKYIPDITTGELRANESLDVWAVSRHFASHPTLSSEFIHVNKSDYDYLFAVQDQPQAVVTFNNIIKAVRPLHKFSMPTLGVA